MSKTIKNTFLAAMAMAVLCAGTVSARQLRQASTVTVCTVPAPRKCLAATFPAYASYLPEKG